MVLPLEVPLTHSNDTKKSVKHARILEDDLAEQARNAAQDAVDRLVDAVGAATLSASIRAARPAAELARELGDHLGEILRDALYTEDGDDDSPVIDVTERKR